jgi:hypothetical protein
MKRAPERHEMGLLRVEPTALRSNSFKRGFHRFCARAAKENAIHSADRA